MCIIFRDKTMPNKTKLPPLRMNLRSRKKQKKSAEMEHTADNEDLTHLIKTER